MSSGATAATDRRRNAGPENSIRPLPEPSSGEAQKGELLDSNMMRKDGRYPEQVRPMSMFAKMIFDLSLLLVNFFPLPSSCIVMKLGVISRAPGSSYIELGNTKLTCCVYGPRSTSARTTSKSFLTQGNVSCEINYAPFASTNRRHTHQPEAEEEDLALLLLQAVCPAIRRELFPNAYLDIYVTVLENDGGVLAAAITAASAALIQARVDMLDSVVACGAVWLPSHQTFLMDPIEAESSGGGGSSGTALPSLTVAMLPNLGSVTQLHSVGILEGGSLAITEALSMCADGINSIYNTTILPLLESSLFS